jgi:hypothetical protein
MGDRLHDLPGTHVRTARVPEEATIGDVDTWSLLRADGDITVTEVVWIPDVAVVGAAAHNFALTVRNEEDDGAGVTAVTQVKTYDNGTDSTAQVPESLALSATAADLDVDEGHVLSLVRSINGNGLASPSGQVEVHYRYR